MTRLAYLAQSGFSLLELAVATAIYSMGLGSVSLLLMMAVQGTIETRDRSLATIHAAEMAELILLQSDAVGHYLAEPPGVPPDCGLGSECSDADLAALHLVWWRRGISRDLPGGRGVVCRDGSPDDGNADEPGCDGVSGPVVKVFWDTAGGNPQPGDGRIAVAVPLP